MQRKTGRVPQLGMTTLRKLELAWKYRRPLIKYRKLIRYRKQILFAAAVGVGAVAVVMLRMPSRNADSAAAAPSR